MTRLAADPRRYPWQAHARGLVAHLVYGLVTDTALSVLKGPGRLIRYPQPSQDTEAEAQEPAGYPRGVGEARSGRPALSAAAAPCRAALGGSTGAGRAASTLESTGFR